jgi:hypothetical protein
MNLRRIALLTAITQLLVLAVGTINYVSLFSKLHWENNSSFFIIEPIYLLAHAMITLFFFILFAELKRP